MESGAYGASLAGGAFDLASFVKLPQTVVRLLAWLCAIVVFATITAEGYTNESSSGQTTCIFNGSDGACSYANAIGVIAFLACVFFLMLDAYFPQISNAKDRRNIVIADLAFSILWTLLWFVCFCLLANQWSHTKTDNIPADAGRAVVTFSFFSVVCFALLIVFAWRRYQQGVASLDSNYTDPSQDHSTPYPSAFPASEGYQQSPFSNAPQRPAEGVYQPPNY
ncbi:synaptogyrin-2a [Denticeps clupeoides]|uniref:Synaptogyrin n=1 Tax=Denticeps clupeoides TaxID=299321 RepID=A0AAY4ASA2_9TELE|nr:synaptogyrin-2-like [Denticeps clupeoides]XP_028842739.1 synaptogyrin-2-like [Denticeps clupeoides]